MLIYSFFRGRTKYISFFQIFMRTMIGKLPSIFIPVTEAPTPKPDNPPFQVLTNGSTLSYILWGATAFALVILSLRLIIAFIQRARRRFQHNSPIRKLCTIIKKYLKYQKNNNNALTYHRTDVRMRLRPKGKCEASPKIFNDSKRISFSELLSSQYTFNIFILEQKLKRKINVRHYNIKLYVLSDRIPFVNLRSVYSE